MSLINVKLVIQVRFVMEMRRLGVSSLLVAKSTWWRQDMAGKLEFVLWVLRFSLFALLRPSFFPTFWFYINSFFIFLFFYHSLSFYHHRIILWFLICFLVVDSSFTKRRGIITFVSFLFSKSFFFIAQFSVCLCFFLFANLFVVWLLFIYLFMVYVCQWNGYL